MFTERVLSLLKELALPAAPDSPPVKSWSCSSMSEPIRFNQIKYVQGLPKLSKGYLVEEM